VKLHDKKAALESLARHLGLYLEPAVTETTPIDSLPPLQIIVRESLESRSRDGSAEVRDGGELPED
jgi:hypothetical protein